MYLDEGERERPKERRDERQLSQDRKMGQTLQEKRTYANWCTMMGRCYKPYYKGYEDYGRRGIKVCARWHDFDNFVADMGLKPEGLMLERVDNDGDYEPGNCVWATREEQARNRTNTILLTYNGRTMCAKDWARELGLVPTTVYTRIRRGFPVEQVLAPGKMMLTHDGRTMSVKEWANELGVSLSRMYYHTQHGLTIEEIIKLSQGQQ
jgi:hypothetical protein